MRAIWILEMLSCMGTWVIGCSVATSLIRLHVRLGTCCDVGSLLSKWVIARRVIQMQ